MATSPAKVRRQSSARHGVEHWKFQRLTALANVVLLLWFVWSLVSLSGSDYASKAAWLSTPINAAFMSLLVISVFYHAKLGLQVVIEDYVHDIRMRTASLILVTFAAIVMAAACIMSIIRLLAGS